MTDERMRQAGEFMWQAHRRGAAYENLPVALQPASVEEAYTGQAAFHRLAAPLHGAIGGWKIATTTKVMQELMGIRHPCAGAIFASRIHQSPAELRAKDYVSLKIECELAFRLGVDLPPRGHLYGEATILDAVDAVMPAFELVDDRRAVYRETSALSLIVDNAWNAGIVLGAPLKPVSLPKLHGLAGSLQIADRPRLEGKSDNPLQALAWVANLIAGRGIGLSRGMVVMTGSIVPTQPIADGQRAIFRVEGLGEVRLKVV